MVHPVNDSKSPKVVVIGGGTGSFTLLTGLKEYVSDLTALVNMSDDGGSTGILRDELGVLPPGDIRQCLVALSDSPKVRNLFNYRFAEGSLKGHTFGNLFLSAVEKMSDSFIDAVELASEVLHIQGRVLPMTLDNATLMLKRADGEVVRGEFKIGHLPFGTDRRPELYFEDPVRIAEQSRRAIEEADVIVIAPGNLYGSLAPALIVDGVGEALQKTDAKVVYVCNLVTKPNQTDEFTVTDYVNEIERFIGAPVLDYVIYNTDEPPKTLIEKYTQKDERIVEFNLEEFESAHYRAIGLPLVASAPIVHAEGDSIAKTRSLIRHDTDAIARALMGIFFE